MKQKIVFIKTLWGMILFALLILHSSAQAATFNVNSATDAVDATWGNGICATATGPCTLRAAIQEANALTGKDTIILPAGTYNLTITGRYEDGSATGDLDITQGVIIQGAGAATTFVAGNEIDRVFHVLAGIVEISGITIRGGKAVNQYGGGIYNYIGILTITDCTVFSNRSDYRAGGIYNYAGQVEIMGSIISGNTAVYLSGYGDGGGIYNENGVVTITDSTVSGNIASGYGWTGGIINGGTMTIENSTINGNTADLYAGIDSFGNMTITNSTIFNNSSTASYDCGGGAGVINENIITIQNSTIAGNSPINISNGDDCYLYGGTFSIRNSIVSNTTPRVNCVMPDVPFDSSSKNNLSTDNTCGAPFVQKTASEINLGPLADNGGPTDTIALLTGSVAIDGGDDESCPGTDQRGVLRPQGTHCDIGAFESTEPKSDQTITVDEDAHAPENAAYNDDFTVSATATSGLDVAITTSGSCSGSGTGSAIITMTNGTGTCTVFFDQAGDGTYNPAPQVIEYTAAQKVDQTINVSQHAPENAAYNGSFTVSATATSGLDVAITTSGSCSGSGTGSAIITMTNGTGTCTVFFDQAGDGAYNPASQMIEYTAAQKADQTINVSQHAPASAAYNDDFTVSATATSGLGVAITSSGACSGSGTGSAIITMTNGTGTCTVFFDQAGDGAYNAAPHVTEYTGAQKADQTINVSQHAPENAAYSGSFTVSATATSGLGAAITTSGACSGSGTGSAVITMTNGTGTCTIFFDQAGNGLYNPAQYVTESTIAQKVSQTITVTQHALASAAYNGSFTVSANATSGLGVAITTSGSCSGSGTGSVTITMSCGTGPCMVHYNQVGNSNYNTSSEATETTSVRSTLAVIFSGTGEGSVSGDGIDCSWDGTESSGTCGCCYNDAPFLQPITGACTFFDGWQTSYTENGTIETARFEKYPIVRFSSTQGSYASITEAFTNSPDGETIQIQAHTFDEDLILDGPGKNVTFDSGWNCDYTGMNGSAAVKSLTIVYGSIVFKNGSFVIEP